ncbi:hypothetical protein HN51_000422 [Arachis hypogaea]|uniref:non-specific serine/threonine protein kinase n=1 Tax=Arachis hypogaea TaxID=3818 RepID=A0A445EW05_ARAHY|nr:Putative serine/threonine-protein kinase-like protein [Arachis hypogaea]RYR79601.1 hypothetical protein Ahy_A01g004411 [Arachis hypogaea]
MMKTTPPPSYSYHTHSFFLTVILIITAANAIGSASTTAVIYASSTVCVIVAGNVKQYIHCYQQNQHKNSHYYYYGDVAPVDEVVPHVSFESISGGRSFFCGLRSGGLSLLCWDVDGGASVLVPKRIFHSEVVQLTDLTVGDSQVCARESQSGVVRCWRGGRIENGFKFYSPGKDLWFKSITSGSGFSCGVLMDNGKVHCWGNNNSSEIQAQFDNISMSKVIAGVSHVCGLTIYDGFLICKGNNDSGQLGPNLNSSSYYSEFSGLALGEDFTCGIRRKNGFVLCWGGAEDTKKFDLFNDVSFESIVAGLDFVCGVTTMNLSLICWGPGWSNNNGTSYEIPLGIVLPSPCVRGGCDSSCASYPNSDYLCHGSGTICYSCQDSQIPLTMPLILPPPLPSSTQVSNVHHKNMRVILVILIVGSIGAFSGLCTILYFLWIGAKRLFLKKRDVDNSEQPQRSDDSDDDDDDAYIELAPLPANRASNATLGSLKRHRSVSSSSSKHNLDRIENFSLHELVTATDNFSNDNKIGSGSFGSVYKGKLADDREVAIKRGDIVSSTKKKFQEKEIAFDSELSLLSRLHHKHLVRLIGFCEENEERLLVYEYMSNGSIHEHLHNKNNVEKNSSILNSWKMRIKIALDAARGIEYIHNYAVPPIIHRDIKSSNILLDSNWNAKVSDFGLSLILPEMEQDSTPIKAVGTVGYIDPEYYELNVLTTKSDVYSLGVVMLELLTGKRVVFKLDDESSPVGIVEYARPRIAKGELCSILDYRIEKPNVNELEALKIMTFIAIHCVNLEGKERPEMAEVVANLERASAFLEGSSSTSFSIVSCSN